MKQLPQLRLNQTTRALSCVKTARPGSSYPDLDPIVYSFLSTRCASHQLYVETRLPLKVTTGAILVFWKILRPKSICRIFVYLQTRVNCMRVW